MTTNHTTPEGGPLPPHLWRHTDGSTFIGYEPASPAYGYYTEYISKLEVERLQAERDKSLTKIREAFNELLDEIDSQQELGGPSFEGSDLAKDALLCLDEILSESFGLERGGANESESNMEHLL